MLWLMACRSSLTNAASASVKEPASASDAIRSSPVSCPQNSYRITRLSLPADSTASGTPTLPHCALTDVRPLSALPLPAVNSPICHPAALHDHYRQSFRCRILQTFPTCLTVFIQIIILNHTEIPVIGIHQFTEILCISW